MKNALDTAARQTLATWLRESDAVLVGAGAGLSAAAGFNFADREAFAARYPALVRQGFRNKLEFIGRTDIPPALRWGYYLAHVQEVRYAPPPQGVYQDLRALLHGKDWFVFTTNADGRFEVNGFDKERIFTPQGDYSRWQCLEPCTEETWPTEELIERVLPHVDPATQRLPEHLVPRCPRCGGDTFLNVRGGDWFVEAPYQDGAARYAAWLEQQRSRRLLLLEIGAGFNTPGWIRYPFERLLRTHAGARLVRVNPQDAQVPGDTANRSLSLPLPAGAVITPWLQDARHSSP